MKSVAYRAVATLAVTLGVGLLIAPFALQLWDRTPAAERTFDRFEFLMNEQGLRNARALFNTTRDGGLQLVNEAAPAFAEQLNMTPGQFERFMQRNFPAVAQGIEDIPEIAAFVSPIVDGLEAGGDEYESAQSIPGFGLPLTSTPWLAIGLGLILVTAGSVALLRPGRGTTIALLAVGGVMVVAPFALGLPEKTANAREIGDVAKLGLGPEGAKLPRQNVQKLVELTEQTRKQLVPQLATHLKVSEADLQAQIARDFPALNKYLTQYDDLLEQATVVLVNQEAAVPDFAKADAIPVKALPWLVVVPGLLLSVVAGTLLVVGRRRDEEPAAPVVTQHNGEVREPALT